MFPPRHWLLLGALATSLCVFMPFVDAFWRRFAGAIQMMSTGLPVTLKCGPLLGLLPPIGHPPWWRRLVRNSAVSLPVTFGHSDGTVQLLVILLSSCFHWVLWFTVSSLFAWGQGFTGHGDWYKSIASFWFALGVHNLNFRDGFGCCADASVVLLACRGLLLDVRCRGVCCCARSLLSTHSSDRQTWWHARSLFSSSARQQCLAHLLGHAVQSQEWLGVEVRPSHCPVPSMVGITLGRMIRRRDDAILPPPILQ